MRKLWMFAFAGALLLTSCGNDKVDLALHLKEGETYKQSTSATVDMEQEFMGQKMSTEVNYKGDVDFHVNGMEGDAYDVDVTYKFLSLEMKSPQGTMTFDSETVDTTNIMTELMTKMLQGLKSDSFTIILEKTGKVKEVKGLDVLFENVLGEFPNVPQMQKEQLKQQMNASYGEDALKGNFEMLSAIFPEKTVGKGDVWTIETQLKAINTSVSTDYHIEEIAGDYIVLKGETTLTPEDFNEAPKLNSIPGDLNLEGTYTSVIKLDKETGWIIDATMEQDLEGDMKVKMSPADEEEMSIPMKMNQKLHITDKEVE
ncbi:DUF6263 family protein [Neptunitalea lumnitzerae]|uniref:Lipoprotein n=1 Tax=Neptunitalea lumnitzerae TaxID=2965509 RepID=A0ABQ5MF98_9FLAO|nr:DUF6263 family protein [Neptunitalea sp. Y10]GLB48081.1 hypothetical protein Y10_04490 [Neptunitalea sp. Y10]